MKAVLLREAPDARLIDVARARVRQVASRIEMAERELRAVGPMAVLERGYSCTMTEDGRLVRSPEDVSPGARLDTRLARGSIWSIVEGENRPARPPRRSGRTSGDDEQLPQMDLFEPDH